MRINEGRVLLLNTYIWTNFTLDWQMTSFIDIEKKTKQRVNIVSLPSFENRSVNKDDDDEEEEKKTENKQIKTTRHTGNYLNKSPVVSIHLLMVIITIIFIRKSILSLTRSPRHIHFSDKMTCASLLLLLTGEIEQLNRQK